MLRSDLVFWKRLAKMGLRWPTARKRTFHL